MTEKRHGPPFGNLLPWQRKEWSLVPSKAAMQEFLSHKRIAVVGVSRDPKQFANAVMRALLERGYDAVAINPHASELEGHTAYPTLAAVPGELDGAIVLLPSGAHATTVDDAISARVPRLWFQSASGQGTSPDLAVRAKQGGISLIDGGCPFMALENAGWFHRFHAGFARLTGSLKP